MTLHVNDIPFPLSLTMDVAALLPEPAAQTVLHVGQSMACYDNGDDLIALLSEIRDGADLESVAKRLDELSYQFYDRAESHAEAAFSSQETVYWLVRHVNQGNVSPVPQLANDRPRPVTPLRSTRTSR